MGRVPLCKSYLALKHHFVCDEQLHSKRLSEECSAAQAAGTHKDDKRREDKEKTRQDFNNSKGSTLGSNAKPGEPEHRQWGNQNSSQPVWVEEI